MDCSPPGSSVHGILQARALEWVAIPFSGGSPNPGIKRGPSALQADSWPSEPPGKPKEAQTRPQVTLEPCGHLVLHCSVSGFPNPKLDHSHTYVTGAGQNTGSPCESLMQQLTLVPAIASCHHHYYGYYCSKPGVPNLQVRISTSRQMSGGIRLEIRCATDVMRLNHPQTIPRPCPARGKTVFHETYPWYQKGWRLLL